MTENTIIPIVLNILFTMCLMITGSRVRRSTCNVSESSFVNGQFNYQVLLMTIAGISIITTFISRKENFIEYFTPGNISAVGEELRIFGIVLGIKQGDSWIKTGLSLWVLVSVLAVLFVGFFKRQEKIDRGLLRGGMFWILVFSATNSFGEEMIYRMGIVAPLKGLMAPATIFSLSGVLSGFYHFAGRKNGFAEAVLAGFLGFVLAKSMYETQGFFWAWIIHFQQDLIVGALFFLSFRTLKPK